MDTYNINIIIIDLRKEIRQEHQPLQHLLHIIISIITMMVLIIILHTHI